MAHPLPQLLPLLQAGGTLPDPDLPVAELRALADAGVVAAGALVRPPSRPVSVERLAFAGYAGPVPLVLYRPENGSVGIHLHLHGGGWWMGSTATADAMCRELAAATGLTVASIDYALAPESPWPAAAEDCYAAAGVLARRTERLSIGGESAGANLAAVVALMARDRRGPALLAQWLDVPALDLALPDTPSLVAYREGFGLPLSEARLRISQYAPGDLTHPYVSPLHAPDLSGLPPALVSVAELDPLHDQGTAYAALLQAAGTPATTYLSEGHLHGTTWLTALTPSAADWHARGVAFLHAAHDELAQVSA